MRGSGAWARARLARMFLPLLLAVAMAGVPGSGGTARAQEALDAVESLAAAGRTGEARQRLLSWWEGAADRAPRLEIQRALWLKGRLSTDGRDAERAYQRLVVEYPGGEYTARALVRLGQLAHARGDLPGAAERFRTVVRDHAQTPQRLEALRWLERHGARAEELAALGAAPGPAPRVPRREEEERAVPAAPEASPDPAPAPAPDPPPEPPPEPPEAGPFAVQVGAFSRLDGARALAVRVEGEGLAARLARVPGSELIRVRVGRFRSAAEAGRMQASLRRLGFETAVVSDAAVEIPVR